MRPLLAQAWRAWLRVRESLIALKPCRVPIVLVAGGLAFLLAGAIFFLIAVSARRAVARGAYRNPKDRRMLQNAPAQKAIAVLNLPRAPRT